MLLGGNGEQYKFVWEGKYKVAEELMWSAGEGACNNKSLLKK
jgi:hypothetical protein